MRVEDDDILIWPDGSWAFRKELNSPKDARVIADDTRAWWDFMYTERDNGYANHFSNKQKQL
jgi:hypothetical protein